MNIAVIGSAGQLGSDLVQFITQSKNDRVYPFTHQDLDCTNLSDVKNALQHLWPNLDAVINCAAYVRVDDAEDNPRDAFLVNAIGAKNIADACNMLDIACVYISTDYVFDGTKTCAYIETDIPNPQSIYGKTKLQGEQAIEVSGCMYLIFRTSWVYAARGKNFVTTIIRLAKEHNEVKVVSDQIGAPTSAELIADVTSLCLYLIFQDKVPKKNRAGIFHLTPTGKSSWYGFAKFIMSEMKKLGDSFHTNPENIISINASENHQQANRPANSLLDSQKLCKTFGIYLPSWQVHARRVVKKLYLQEAQ